MTENLKKYLEEIIFEVKNIRKKLNLNYQII